ncbi:hypothetical protein LTR86_007328 [Recurvomyces mirabilis]|nr:hypothetical protein LTR86_007328 [Recurvomyces mirabilis]
MSDQFHKYLVYNEHSTTKPGKGKAVHDGQTLYRALAQQIIGDPAGSPEIKLAVMHFAIRVRSNRSHPLHKAYLHQQSRFMAVASPVKALFGALEAPDLATNEPLLLVVAHALGVRISVYHNVLAGGLLPQPVLSVGSYDLPHHRLLLVNGGNGSMATFSSLMVDDSGKVLVQSLLDQQRTLE